MSTRYQ